MEINFDCEVDEVEPNVYEKKVQKRWILKDQRQENLRANIDNNKSEAKDVPEERKSKSSTGGRSKAIRTDVVECGHIPDKNQPDMVAIMSTLLRQQATPDVDVVIFTSNSVEYHYFIAVFDKVVQKNIGNPRGSLTKLIEYTDDQPKDMIKYFTKESAAVGYKNARSLLEEGIKGINLNQQMEHHI